MPEPTPQSAAADERLLGEWQEPAAAASSGGPGMGLVIGGSVLAVAALIAMGYFLKDSTYYFGAVAAVAFALAIGVQRRGGGQPRGITLSTAHIQIGKKDYVLADMAGFWLKTDAGQTVINLEPKKVSAFPLSFLHTASESEARAVMLNVLPELEPRQDDITDRVSRYFKL